METKERILYTIDKEILKEFNEITKELAFNRSALVEKFMKNWIKEHKTK